MSSVLSHRFGAVFIAVVWCLPSSAQTVYESKDKSGATVFSDRPTPGAKPVELQAPNVIPSPPLPQRKPAPAAAAPGYTSLSISSLENEGTVHTNTGEFQFLVRSVPSLRASAGDRIKVALDGNTIAKKYSSGAVNVSADDWQAAAREVDLHTLQVAIVDANGTTLIESKPVTFYARRATVRRQAR